MALGVDGRFKVPEHLVGRIDQQPDLVQRSHRHLRVELIVLLEQLRQSLVLNQQVSEFVTPEFT
jgi:hypothetical protein